MKKLVLSFIASSVVLLLSCGGSENTTSKNNSENEVSSSTEISCLDFAVTEKYSTLDPIKVTDIYSFHIASQILEPLLRFDDKDLSLQPVIANSWVISEDNLTYTFALKKGVHFQDNACFPNGKGRELTANDVIYTFKRIYSEKQNLLL